MNQGCKESSNVRITNRWTSRLGICLDRPNFVLIVGVVSAHAAALVNSMLGVASHGSKGNAKVR
jgi:hypothetical protein